MNSPVILRVQRRWQPVYITGWGHVNIVLARRLSTTNACGQALKRHLPPRGSGWVAARTYAVREAVLTSASCKVLTR